MTEWPAVPEFPAGFRWGTATAALQIEGALDADGRGRSIWDGFPTRTGDTPAVATDSYRRWRDDVALLAGLGANAYRFSIAWPRVQSDGRGEVNKAGLDYYDRLVDGLREAGIDPVVTLYHWDLPQALEDTGGWLDRDTAYRFADYAGHVYDALGDRVALWITHNEPFVHAAFGYALGEHAPGRQLLEGSFPAVHHLLLSHGLAVGVLRSRGAAQVGITQNLAPAVPASDSEADIRAAYTIDGWQNRTFCDPMLLGAYPAELDDLYAGASAVIRDGDLATIAAPTDFLGVNYYNPTRVRAAETPLGFEFAEYPDVEHTGFGWPIVPSGLTDLLLMLRDRYPNLPPVHITENGAAFPDEVAGDGTVDDPRRVAYLADHLGALKAAMDAGVDVRGYFCWSLLDNFEWAEGYSQRFGLVHVDFATGRRTPKTSYRFFRHLATR